MMKRTTKGTFTLMKPRLLLLALLAAAATLVIGGSLVLAQTDKAPPTVFDTSNHIPYVHGTNPMKWNIPYEFQVDPDYPPYTIALKAMMPTYKGTLEFDARPVIGIGEIDLNYDKQSEIISFPVEDVDFYNNFCNLNRLCPHYVIEVQGKKAQVIGILYGYKVNRGDRIINKYLTLKVYNAPKKSMQYFEEYAYDPKTNEYGPVKK